MIAIGFMRRMKLKTVENRDYSTMERNDYICLTKPKPIMFTLLLRFYRDRFLSRWTVLFFDLTATFIALVASIAIRFSFSVDEAQRVLNIYSFLGVLALYCLGFILIGSYKGILRHTSLDDVKNVLKSFYVRFNAFARCDCISLLLAWFRRLLPGKYSFLPLRR